MYRRNNIACAGLFQLSPASVAVVDTDTRHTHAACRAHIVGAISDHNSTSYIDCVRRNEPRHDFFLVSAVTAVITARNTRKKCVE